MFVDLTWLIPVTYLAAAATMAAALLLVPAFIELRMPKDAGPRLLVDASSKVIFNVLSSLLRNIESAQEPTYPLAIEKTAFLQFMSDIEF